MNHEAVAFQCCEKLSQVMTRISKEAEDKKEEQKEWQSKKEVTRYQANKLRFSPINLNVKICESKLNAEAYCAATREIESVGQRYREIWRRCADNKQLLKEIDLERDKLIHREAELFLFRQRANTGDQADRESRLPVLINEFVTKFNKLKNCLNKVELMLRRYEISLNDVISEGSQAKLLLTELQTRFQERQKQEARFYNQLRTYAIVLQTKSLIRHRGKGDFQRQNTLKNYNDEDEEILKKRLLNERETNKQLESLVTYARNWLLQEEHLTAEMKMLTD